VRKSPVQFALTAMTLVRFAARWVHQVVQAVAAPKWALPAAAWLALALAAVGSGIAIGAQYTRTADASDAHRLSCHDKARAMTRLELLFGTSRSQGAPITDEDWASFLETEVTPRFPTGLTVLRGAGQWSARDGLLAKEQTNIVVIWHEPSRRADADIEAIRSAYKARFAQESVFRVDSVSCVSF
jgi:hypothetical protein